jgi:hypothetical protein
MPLCVSKQVVNNISFELEKLFVHFLMISGSFHNPSSKYVFQSVVKFVLVHEVYGKIIVIGTVKLLREPQS